MIDTHAHLLCFEDADRLISNMKDDGLSAVVNIGTTVKDSIEGHKLALENPNIFATVKDIDRFLLYFCDIHSDLFEVYGYFHY